jgi:hypothetical protein
LAVAGTWRVQGRFKDAKLCLALFGILECRQGGFQRENGPEIKDAKSKKLASLVGPALAFCTALVRGWGGVLFKLLNRFEQLAQMSNLSNLK